MIRIIRVGIFFLVLSSTVCVPVIVIKTVLNSTTWVSMVFNFGALLNQISKMWGLKEIEFIAVFRFMSITHKGPGAVADPIALMRMVPDLAVQALGRFQALLFLQHFDVGTTAKVFYEGYRSSPSEAHETLRFIFTHCSSDDVIHDH
mmetsp:Transcript_95735/g.165223  ORF Transcript_95735/g.165223 Transcript_95735/m.165223 type:complete len:147 (+) Transcript_95735:2-442(+)